MARKTLCETKVDGPVFVNDFVSFLVLFSCQMSIVLAHSSTFPMLTTNTGSLSCACRCIEATWSATVDTVQFANVAAISNKIVL